MTWLDALAKVHQACRDTFGVPVSYFPSTRNHPELEGNPVSVTGIFDDQQETISLLGAGERGIDTLVRRTTLEVRLADIAFAPMAGDEVVVGGVTYLIRTVSPDCHGNSLLTLDLKI